MLKRPNRLDDPKQVFRSPQMFLAFGFGSGLSPVVPGTVGTLAAIPPYILLMQLGWVGYGIAVLIAALLGIYLCASAAKTLGVHDHSGIVWDEFVGFWITMFLIPFEWEWIFIGFIFFRFFDMVKPWPISLLDKHVHGGFGIMIDDIAAGVAAALCLHGVVALV